VGASEYCRFYRAMCGLIAMSLRSAIVKMVEYVGLIQ
jgi:hypothetical protein